MSIKFCKSMLNEAVECLMSQKLVYSDTIIIGDNSSGKSEVLRRYMEEVGASRILYFIDSVNRTLNIQNAGSIHEKLH